jgi:hypothetical protein
VPREGVTARERLRSGVEAALLSVGGGFVGHPDNALLREHLASGALPLPEYFGQLLRLVYRLIFLLAAEDRNLLHPPTAPAGARASFTPRAIPSAGCATNLEASVRSRDTKGADRRGATSLKPD